MFFLITACNPNLTFKKQRKPDRKEQECEQSLKTRCQTKPTLTQHASLFCTVHTKKPIQCMVHLMPDMTSYIGVGQPWYII